MSQEEAEASADMWICGPSSFHFDDIKTQCADCQRPIYHRPHAPKRAKKICIPCATKSILLAVERGEDVQAAITEKVFAEVKAFVEGARE